jgi:hypothetical protein
MDGSSSMAGFGQHCQGRHPEAWETHSSRRCRKRLCSSSATTIGSVSSIKPIASPASII